MRSQSTSLRVLTTLALSLIAFLLMSTDGDAKQRGLSDEAAQELSDAGVDQYIGAFTPATSEPFGQWTKHTFDPDFGPLPQGPVCIAGTPYSMFTRAGDPKKLLIFLQGGGACWQDFTNCNILAEDQFPPPDEFLSGIFDFSSPDNPFADYSIVYMPYCDGSVFGGDNDVFDTNFPFGPVRFHRGLRNVSAGMDVAADTFPNPRKITVAGSSAGGAGAAAFAPFLARLLYGNRTDLTVFNDAGPLALDPDGRPDAAAARAADWDFAKFYPASCTECSAQGQQTEIIQWRLDNDSTIRESFYETDADGTNRFFASTNTPGLPVGFLTQSEYRDIILTEHDALNRAHRSRYRRFIVSGDATHTALQSDGFYNQDANGVLLSEWTTDFVLNGDGDSQGNWRDIVEDLVPVPF
jgi:hypothetical protein